MATHSMSHETLAESARRQRRAEADAYHLLCLARQRRRRRHGKGDVIMTSPCN